MIYVPFVSLGCLLLISFKGFRSNEMIVHVVLNFNFYINFRMYGISVVLGFGISDYLVLGGKACFILLICRQLMFSELYVNSQNNM